MTVRLQDVKLVDVKSRILLSGYFKDLLKFDDNDERIVPDLVFNICLLFYYLREHFSLVVDGSNARSPCFKLSNDDRTAALVDSCYGTVYGDVKIDSLSEVVCQWSIKVIRKLKENASIGHNSHKVYMFLGISGDKPDTEKYLDANKLPLNSFLCATPWEKENVYGAPQFFNKTRIVEKLLWITGDVISIRLDLQKRNIEYFINNESIGIIYRNIPIGEEIKYRLAISMVCNGTSATIESHQYL